MRKFALPLICFVSAVSAMTAEDLPPPPFVAPPESSSMAAPPPPAINIDDVVPEPAREPSPTPVPAAENPTMLPTEGVKAGKEAPPVPVLILGDEASIPAPALAPAPAAVETPTSAPTPAPSPAPAEAPAAPVINMEALEAPAPLAPPPPVISMPGEAQTPASPTSKAGIGYEQIGGSKGEPPSWFFTPEALSAPLAPAAPVINIVADTPTQTPTPTLEPTAVPPTATPQAVEAPAAPVISMEAPVAEPSAAATETVPLTVKLEKPKPGADLLNDTVEAEMKKAPKKNPEESFAVALLLGRGRELEAKGRFYEAWRTYRDIVKDHPSDLRGWGAMNSFYAMRLTERARRLEKQKRYFEAANLYRDIVTRDASVATAWWGLGNIFYKYHKKEQALYCFDRVIHLKPKMKAFKKWVKEYRGK